MSWLMADLELARRLEGGETQRHQDLVLGLMASDAGAGAGVMDVAGGCVYTGGPGSPVQGALGLGMRRPVTAHELDLLERFCRDAGEPARLGLCPLADPSLQALAAERGYTVERFFNVLARRVSRADAEGDEGGLGYRIEILELAGERHVPYYFRAFLDWDPDGNEPIDPAMLRLARAILIAPGFATFVCWIDGEPAGVGSLYIRNGLGMLFAAHTRPRFRRRGVQSALVRARLAVAAGRGCDLLCTTTSPPGNESQRNLHRGGFQVVYTRPVLARLVP